MPHSSAISEEWDVFWEEIKAGMSVALFRHTEDSYGAAKTFTAERHE